MEVGRLRTFNHSDPENSPPMFLAGQHFFSQIWSDRSERSLDEKVCRSSPDGGGQRWLGRPPTNMARSVRTVPRRKSLPELVRRPPIRGRAWTKKFAGWPLAGGVPTTGRRPS